MQTPESSLYVPPELLGEIFTHCDAATLAVLSRASFACLELTSKLLYTDITLKDVKAIAMLFRLESTIETPPLLSDRVNPHTSLTLNHSVTLFDKGDMDFTVLNAYQPLPPPLPLRFLAISVPTFDNKVEINLLRLKLHPVLDLFNPRILLLRGRRAPLPTSALNIARYVHLYNPASGHRSTLPWTRLEVVIQSGATFFVNDLHVLRRCVAATAGSPLKLVWDLLDFEADPKRQLSRTMAYRVMEYHCLKVPREHYDVRAWVASGDIKVGALTTESDYLSVSEARKFREAAIKIPSDRVRRLRDAFVEHGVRKDKDWAALDDL